MGHETPARDAVLVRNLRPEDQEAVVAIDARSVGRRRDEFFKLKLGQAFADTGIAVSLAAELQGRVAGFLLALGIRTLQTEVSWDSPQLLTFFHHQGFRPAARLCLDLDLERTRQS